MSKPRLARRIFKGFAVLAMLGVLGAGLLLGALWPMPLIFVLNKIRATR